MPTEDFGQYIRQGELSKKDKAAAWQTAIGLQAVDGLTPYFSYEGLSAEQSINHLCRFIANLWQIHPFGEGNTRTAAVFLMKYLSNFGFKVDNEAFAKNSWYFRNALVRANYTNIQKGIHSTYEPLERFMRFLLLGEKPDLRNRTLHIHASEIAESKVQNKPINSLGLQKLAVVKAIEANDTVTLDQLAAVLGKSRSTIKRIIEALKEKGVLDREGARKTGRWGLKIEE